MYLALKFIHVFGVILFLGNIITGAFWHTHALVKGDPAFLAHTIEGIIRADRLFTIPGVALLIVGGFGAAAIGGLPILGTGWIFWSLVLFIISGVVFMVRLAPLQRRMRELALTGTATGSFDLAAYRTIASQWAAWGIAATLTPLAAAVLMILKPAF